MRTLFLLWLLVGGCSSGAAPAGGCFEEVGALCSETLPGCARCRRCPANGEAGGWWWECLAPLPDLAPAAPSGDAGEVADRGASVDDLGDLAAAPVDAAAADVAAPVDVAAPADVAAPVDVAVPDLVRPPDLVRVPGLAVDAKMSWQQPLRVGEWVVFTPQIDGPTTPANLLKGCKALGLEVPCAGPPGCKYVDANCVQVPWASNGKCDGFAAIDGLLPYLECGGPRSDAGVQDNCKFWIWPLVAYAGAEICQFQGGVKECKPPGGSASQPTVCVVRSP